MFEKKLVCMYLVLLLISFGVLFGLSGQKGFAQVPPVPSGTAIKGIMYDSTCLDNTNCTSCIVGAYPGCYATTCTNNSNDFKTCRKDGQGNGNCTQLNQPWQIIPCTGCLDYPCQNVGNPAVDCTGCACTGKGVNTWPNWQWWAPCS